MEALVQLVNLGTEHSPAGGCRDRTVGINVRIGGREDEIGMERCMKIEFG